VRRPRTKGKVEKPFQYLEHHLIQGHSWTDFEAFGRDLLRFATEVLDVREHHTTHQPPLDRFAEEAPYLTPLPTTRYIGIHALTRKVSWDCLIPYEGSRYSVLCVYAGKRVWVRVSQGVRLEALGPTGAVIARHVLSETKGATIIEPAHYEGLRKDTPHTRVVLVEAFQRRFPDAGLPRRVARPAETGTGASPPGHPGARAAVCARGDARRIPQRRHVQYLLAALHPGRVAA
jgi:hypothetical protein